MQAQLTLQPHDYANAVAALMDKMPLERAVQVYEFARFLQSQPTYPPPIMLDDEDWLQDSEETMAAEDARWEATYTRHHDRFAALAATAQAEIAAGSTKPMFANDGTVDLP